jgi:hypothetical protein
MAYTKIGDTCRVSPASQKPKTIVGRDRLNWHKADGRLFLYHGNNRNPLLTVEPDSKYTGMYRIRFPEGGLSDMVNLTRAKDAAIALALQSLNSEVQETPQPAATFANSDGRLGGDGKNCDPRCEAPNGFLAEDRS